jgi:hypothetical protein
MGSVLLVEFCLQILGESAIRLKLMDYFEGVI